jgi:hypothetical protein
MPRKLGRVRLVLEVDAPDKAPWDWVRITQSIPGREGTFTQVWTLKDRKLTDPVWRDLQAFLEGALLAALETVGGVQLQFST